jgi:hypothetical protein
MLLVLQFHRLIVIMSGRTSKDAVYSIEQTVTKHGGSNETTTVTVASSHPSQASVIRIRNQSTIAKTQGNHSNGNLPHPFAGACFVNGTRGYIADPTALKRGIQAFLRQLYPTSRDDIIHPDDYYWEVLDHYASHYQNDTFYYG